MDEELLSLPTRRRLYEAVRRHPGVGARQLQRAAGTGWGETVYHLDRLTAAGLLDWVNAYLILLPLRLQHKLLPRFISWGTVYPWGVRLRYGVLVLAALGGWTQAGRPRSQGAEPESALATTRST